MSSGSSIKDVASADAKARMAGRKFEAIVIGASAGGIKALMQLLGKLPRHFRLAVVVVLHLPEIRESRLEEVFQHYAQMKVSIAEDKVRVCPGNIYFAGPGYHLLIERERTFSLSCEAPLHYSRPSIDILMTSAADAYGSSLAGILLTGANQDGAEGMAAIHQSGGLTVVQEPTEAEIAIMPQAALNLFAPDFILPLAQIERLIHTVENC